MVISLYRPGNYGREPRTRESRTRQGHPDRELFIKDAMKVKCLVRLLSIKLHFTKFITDKNPVSDKEDIFNEFCVEKKKTYKY